MTNSQKSKVEIIKKRLQKDIEEANKTYNKNSILIFEDIIEKDHFCILKIKYQYNAEKSNIFNDESMHLLIGKKGKIDGFRMGFGYEKEIKDLCQIYF